MNREPGLKWLFLDLNSYFASVEQQERPNLRGRPVAVLPLETDSTCVIAASYEAKAYGIKTGTKVYEAKKMCPGLICVLARHNKYVEYHNRIIEEVVKHTPIYRIESIDELSSRLPPDWRAPEKARQLAMRIKHGIWQNIGPAINCSIGIAPNTLLAKIAGEMQKPDGLTFLPQEDLPGKLLQLSLTDLPGIGANMERRLRRAGVNSVESLWNLQPKHARKIWGGVQGERFWYWLHGYDFDRPETKNVMIGHSRVLDPLLRPAPKAKLITRQLLVKAVKRLRAKNYYAGEISLGARDLSYIKWSGNRHLSTPANDPFTFLQALDALWAEMIADFGRHPALSFRKVSVILHGLRRAEEITGDLFLPAAASAPAVKQEALVRAMEHLNGKYRKDLVHLGATPKTTAGFVGTKIAFSRVPDQEEFWE